MIITIFTTLLAISTFLNWFLLYFVWKTNTKVAGTLEQLSGELIPPLIDVLNRNIDVINSANKEPTKIGLK